MRPVLVHGSVKAGIGLSLDATSESPGQTLVSPGQLWVRTHVWVRCAMPHKG